VSTPSKCSRLTEARKPQVANAQALEGDLVQAGESLMKEDVTGRVVKILPSLHFKECKQLLYSQRRSR
jgi:hypothetical protein